MKGLMRARKVGGQGTVRAKNGLARRTTTTTTTAPPVWRPRARATGGGVALRAGKSDLSSLFDGTPSSAKSAGKKKEKEDQGGLDQVELKSDVSSFLHQDTFLT